MQSDLLTLTAIGERAKVVELLDRAAKTVGARVALRDQTAQRKEDRRA